MASTAHEPLTFRASSIYPAVAGLLLGFLLGGLMMLYLRLGGEEDESGPALPLFLVFGVLAQVGSLWTFLRRIVVSGEGLDAWPRWRVGSKVRWDSVRSWRISTDDTGEEVRLQLVGRLFSLRVYTIHVARLGFDRFVAALRTYIGEKERRDEKLS